jgi:aminopeptidase-like protein
MTYNEQRAKEIEDYFDRLWPICRSLTGQGVRDSLQILSELVPMEMHRVKSGSQVFDWTIPKEWNIRAAYIETPDGRRIADISKNNLHVISYSTPVDAEIDYADLVGRIRTLPDQPDAIPYVTSYYNETWGFCLSYNEFKTLPKEGTYRVFIDSDLADGFLDYGEAVLPGSSDQEVLFSTYVCHPSMANNELSGPLVQAFLYREIAKIKNRKYTYRFVFAPETIGVIAYLDRIGQHLKEKLVAGYVITCIGDRGGFTYKQSKWKDSTADRIAKHVLKHQEEPFEIIPFSVGGSDERQYCSPGFNLPLGSLMRTMYQRFSEYHTSLDNKEFISFPHLDRSVAVYTQFVLALELNEKYLNTIPYCEPQLGKRGMYPSSINPDFQRESVHNLMHFLTYADGEHDMIGIAELRDRSIFAFADIIQLCREKGLI